VTTVFLFLTQSRMMKYKLLIVSGTTSLKALIILLRLNKQTKNDTIKTEMKNVLN